MSVKETALGGVQHVNVEHSLSNLKAFPCDLIAKLLLQLSPRDIISLAACCSQLNSIASDAGDWDKRVWRQLCEQAYGSSTSIDTWLQSQDYTPSLYR